MPLLVSLKPSLISAVTHDRTIDAVNAEYITITHQHHRENRIATGAIRQSG